MVKNEMSRIFTVIRRRIMSPFRRFHSASLVYLCSLAFTAYILVNMLPGYLRTLPNNGVEEISMRDLNDETDASFRYEHSVVTLFTTIKDEPKKNLFYFNTIRNWGKLRPLIKPVLILTPNATLAHENLRKTAIDNGWEVVIAKRLNPTGNVFMRDIFLQIAPRFSTPFYGFASADILFDTSLADTVKFLVDVSRTMKSLFLTGRRTNVFFLKPKVIKNLQAVTSYGETVGKLYRVDAEDYFITSNEYPWQQIKDIVVGRPGFDNYIVSTAVQRNMTVIDATASLLALHQCVGKETFYKDTYNINVIGYDFDYNRGSTLMAGYETAFDDTGNLYLKERPK